MKCLRNILMSLIILFITIPLAFAAPVSLVTKETVKAWMDKDRVIILDARQGRDWTSSEFKIKGARRVDPGKPSAWSPQLDRDQKIVIYCA